MWGALISCSFVQQKAPPRQWGSWDRGVVRRVEATQRASPVWVGTAGPSGRPRGTAQGGASQHGLQRHDCRARLGSGGCGGTRSSRKGPHPPLPQDPGRRVSHEVLAPAPGNSARALPTTPPGYLRLLQEAGPETCQAPSSVPQPMSTGSRGLSVFSRQQGLGTNEGESLG